MSLVETWLLTSINCIMIWIFNFTITSLLSHYNHNSFCYYSFCSHRSLWSTNKNLSRSNASCLVLMSLTRKPSHPNPRAQPTETLIEAFTRLDNEILAIESLSPGSRLTTAEAWVEHLESMHLKLDEPLEDKNPTSALDIISEIDEMILDDNTSSSQLSLKQIQTSQSSLDRERSDIMKVKKVCKCSFDYGALFCRN